MAEQRQDSVAATNANVSATDSEADNSDDSQGSRNLKKRKRNQKISCVTSGTTCSGRPADDDRCELCKARKVKCDRAEPSCGWCAKNNR